MLGKKKMLLGRLMGGVLGSLVLWEDLGRIAFQIRDRLGTERCLTDWSTENWEERREGGRGSRPEGLTTCPRCCGSCWAF